MVHRVEYEKDMSWDRVTHIFTAELPCYFAVLSRVYQQKEPVGPRGGVVHSQVVPSVSVAVPPGSKPDAAPLTMEVRFSVSSPSPEIYLGGVFSHPFCPFSSFSFHSLSCLISSPLFPCLQVAHKIQLMDMGECC